MSRRGFPCPPARRLAEAAYGERRRVQYAAGNCWPANNPANAGIRTEFKLSATRSLK